MPCDGARDPMAISHAEPNRLAQGMSIRIRLGHLQRRTLADTFDTQIVDLLLRRKNWGADAYLRVNSD